MKHKVSVLIFLLVLQLFPPRRAHADVLSDATTLFNKLNPVDIALGPLIDHAISSGNAALQQRLEQLRGIVEEALFNLDKIIRDSTIRVNADAGGRLDQLNKIVGDNQELLNSIVQGRIDQLNDASQKRIDQIADAANQWVQILPIPTLPLPKLPPNGFALVRPNGGNAKLYITGAGLTKGGQVPEAYLLSGTSDEKHLFSHDGTELAVKAASMSLVEISIPYDLFPKAGNTEKTIALRLQKGNFLPGRIEQSYPLQMCSSLPTYTATAVVQPYGQVWDTRLIDYPTYNRPEAKGIYITDNGSHDERVICATDADQQDWKADTSINSPNILYGLQFTGAAEHVGSILYNYPRTGCIRIYAEHDRSGGGFAYLYGIQVRQRKLKEGICSAPITRAEKTLKSGPDSIETTPTEALKACLTLSDGAAISPNIRTTLTVKNNETKAEEKYDLITRVQKGYFDGSVTATMDNYGLINVYAKPLCQQKGIFDPQ